LIVGDLTIALLGPPEVKVGGRPAEMDTRKAVAMLAYLVVTGGTTSRDTLAALLWPDHDQEHARSALRRTLSTLRRGVGADRLETDRSSVRLAPGFIADIEEFRGAVRATGDHDHDPADVCPACLEPLDRAARLYRGDFMVGFGLRDSPEFDDWTLQQAEALRRECSRVLERLAASHAARGSFPEAIAAAAKWLGLDELHEPAHRNLMMLHAWAGDRPGAVQRYRDCVRVLDRDLGVMPLEETTSLYEAILEGAEPEPPAARRPVAAVAAAVPPPVAGKLPMVGRDAAMAELETAFRSPAPPGRLVVVRGEAGIGKTRLVEDFADQVRVAGGRPVVGRAFRDEADLPYATVIEALRPVLADRAVSSYQHLPEWALLEAVRLFPELGREAGHLSPAPPLDGPGAPVRFLEALSLLIVDAASPGLLVVDDAHWLDGASARFLAYLIRRLDALPLTVVVTLRPEDASADDPLVAAIDQRAGHGAVTILDLDRLDVGQVAELVEAAGRDRREAGEFHRRSEGVPLFLVAYLTAEDEEPTELRQLLAARRAGLTELARQLLTAASAIGRSFELEVLREVSARTEDEMVLGLEELIGRGLLRELPDGSGLDFTHERLREATYQDATQMRQRLLHRRIAEALAARSPTRAPDPGTMAAVAHHYRAAGLTGEAAVRFAEAGHLARRLHAPQAAVEHYQAALALGHPDRAMLHLWVGELLTLAGDYGAALAELEAAAALLEGGALGAAEQRIGDVYRRLGNWELADRHLEAAEQQVEAMADRAGVLADRAMVAARRFDSDRVGPMAAESLELAGRSHDPSALAHAHNTLGLLDESPDRSRHHLAESLAFAEQAGDPARQVAALNNLAQVERREGNLDPATELTRRALALAAEMGDRHREAALHNNLADLLHASGLRLESMDHLKRAVALFAEVGTEPGALEPEVWKLVEW
jgi:DNA-binding SARP family transcriptional activator